MKRVQTSILYGSVIALVPLLAGAMPDSNSRQGPTRRPRVPLCQHLRPGDQDGGGVRPRPRVFPRRNGAVTRPALTTMVVGR
jgi:hypothetical protein